MKTSRLRLLLQSGRTVLWSYRMQATRQITQSAKFDQAASKPISTAYRSRFMLLGVFPGIKIALCAKERPPLQSSPRTAHDEIVRTADMFYEKHEMKELHELLNEYRNSEEPEVLWRLARATYELAKAAGTDAEKKKLTHEAFELSEKALNLDEKNFACHKWFAILLDEVGKYEGIKYRLQRSPEVKEHFERSIELNPRDPTSHHCLGFWHYSFADLAWYQRKAAEAFFASPPRSTYSEAIKCFEHAEEVQPNFYSMNLLMLAKACTKIGDYGQAGLWLVKLRQFNAVTEEDVRAKKQGEKLMIEVTIRQKST